MKIGVIGFTSPSREVLDYVKAIVEEFKDGDEIIVSGGRGVESTVLRYAKNRKLQTRVIITEYIARNTPHKDLSLQRDHRIIDESDRVYIFSDGGDRTVKAEEYAEQVGKLSKVFRF